MTSRARPVGASPRQPARRLRAPALVPLGLAACGALLLGEARADTVTLNNGHEMHGRLVSEAADHIMLRTSTGRGVIRIEKSEIATFTENDNWGDYQLNPETREELARREAEAAAEDGEGEGEGEGEAGTGPEGEVDPSQLDGEDWEWPAGLSEEEIAELTPIRDKYLVDLEELGPTAEERLALTEASSEEQANIRDIMQLFSYRRRQGSANLRRRNARDRVVNEYGLKAFDQLVDGVGAANEWTKRISAQALGMLCTGGDADDARWLAFHHDVPDKIMSLLTASGDVDAPFTRQDANEALEQITGHSVGYESSTEQQRTAAEIDGAQAWRQWWSRAKREWQTEQEELKTQRQGILDKLAALRRGENPDAEEGEETGEEEASGRRRRPRSGGDERELTPAERERLADERRENRDEHDDH